MRTIKKQTQKLHLKPVGYPYTLYIEMCFIFNHVKFNLKQDQRPTKYVFTFYIYSLLRSEMNAKKGGSQRKETATLARSL